MTRRAAEARWSGAARRVVGGRRSDHQPFKPRSWSGARETAVEMERLFKAVTPPTLHPPKKKPPGPSSVLFFAVEEVFGKGLAESTLCAKLEPFVLLFHSENTLIRTRECLFSELIGSNRWEMESRGRLCVPI